MMQADDDNKNSNKILKIFNYVGGTLIFFGLSYFIMDNWFLLGLALRLLVTLGVACAFFYLAILLCRENKYRYASAVFFILSALLFPAGISVLLNAFGLLINSQMDDIIISGVCFSIFFAAYTIYQRDVLLLFSLVFGSFFYVLTSTYVAEHSIGRTEMFHGYQMMVLGVFYALLGYYSDKYDTSFAGLLNFFGDLLIMGSVFFLGGWLWKNYSPVISLFWEVATPFALLGNFMLSVCLRSRAYLFISTAFLIVLITNFTAKFAYLFGTFGWPLILIVAGLGLMCLGYVVAFLHRRIQK
jgi:hypothetical protein